MSGIKKYGVTWPEGSDPLNIERTLIRNNGYITKGNKRYGNGLFYHYRQMMSLCWPDDDHHRWSDLGLQRICENEITVLMGSSDCVSGETRIFDCSTGELKSISELCRSGTAPVVMTLLGPVKAEVPYLKGVAPMLRVKLANGNSFECTGRHRVLTGRGYVYAESLRTGEPLPSYDEGQIWSSVEPSQTRIESIEKLPAAEFYDLHVPVAHHYCSEGAIHHNSNKTYLISRFVLCDWWAHYENTLWLISSTELRGAELRVWGKIKELFNRARERWPWLPGTVLESKHAITTEDVAEDNEEARLLTKGLIYIPCRSNGRWVGMSAYAGIKPTKNGRLGHAGDEAGFMEPSFLDAYTNWYGKQNFKGLLTGNPTDVEDPLCVAAHPIEGWENWHDTGKTQEWRSKFYNAWVIAFDGRDSPNMDYPADEPVKFPYLIGRKKLEAVAKTEGVDSPLWWQQCVGKPLPGASTRKVITLQLCEQNHAFDSVVWEGSNVTQVVGLDAAYGGIGGDRCVLIRLQFGKDNEGRSIIACNPPVLVPVSVKNPEMVETQIAKFCMSFCDGFGVPPENFFFDTRATLAVEFARVWSPNVNVIDFGGPATKRPVSNDEYIFEGDINTRRLKRCDEHYNKFVTELWFSVRYCILGQQMRQLPREVSSEGYKRLWRYSKIGRPRIEVETKEEMKKRTGQSPDNFDALVTAIEGARRLGFQIESMKSTRSLESSETDWLLRAVDNHRKFVTQHELTYARS